MKLASGLLKLLLLTSLLFAVASLAQFPIELEPASELETLDLDERSIEAEASPYQGTEQSNGESQSESHCSKKAPNCRKFFRQRFPTPDGVCNNRVNPRQGSTERSYKRYIIANYNNSLNSLRVSVNGQPLPSARLVSNDLQGTLSTNTPFTQMLPFWGQFLIHDVALTLEREVHCECGTTNSECINIAIPPNDPQRQIRTCFPLFRSVEIANSEDCDSKIREQENELSAYLDMGLIYGNSKAHLRAIRNRRRRGELIEIRKRGFGVLLPQTNFSSQIEPAAERMLCPSNIVRPPNAKCRVSGEARTNENSVLQSHHTVWMKLHNIVVRQLRRLNRRWSSNRLLQVGKLIVTALHQRVTFEHFLPVIIGPDFMNRFDLSLLRKGYYYGYESSYSAGISNAFTTAAFRMGHALINEMFTRPDNSWRHDLTPPVRVKTSLFNVGIVTAQNSQGVNSFIRGLAKTSAIRFDPTFPDDLRNFLFTNNTGPPEGTNFGDDLLARNIQRGRDHGLPTYLQTRDFCGLPSISSFTELDGEMTVESANRLRSIYANVQDIDLYAGGVSEIAVEGGVVGRTFACLIAYQFRDLKKGDRFWHENPLPIGSFTPDQLNALRRIPFPRILCEIIDGLRTIQPRPLQKVLSRRNLRRPCSSYPRFDLSTFRDPQRTSFLLDNSQDTELTTWFPTNINFMGNPFTVSELYQWLLVHRPLEVCRQVTETNTRQIRGRQQVRFRCLRGTIRHSDFPPVFSEQFFWTQWVPCSGGGNNCSVQVEPPTNCFELYAIQAQTIQGVPAGETGEVFNRFSHTAGLLVCLGRDQQSGSCSRYRVRALCKRRQI